MVSLAPIFLAKTAETIFTSSYSVMEMKMSQSSTSACSKILKFAPFPKIPMISNRLVIWLRTDSSFSIKITSWFSATRERQRAVPTFPPPTTIIFIEYLQSMLLSYSIFKKNSSFLRIFWWNFEKLRTSRRNRQKSRARRDRKL